MTAKWTADVRSVGYELADADSEDLVYSVTLVGVPREVHDAIQATKHVVEGGFIVGPGFSRKMPDEIRFGTVRCTMVVG